MIKFVSIMFIESVSIVLMDRLKKLKTCLSLSMYLLLYSCALPVIYNLVISKGNQKTNIKLKYINTSRCGLTIHQTNIMLEAKENRMNS